MAFTSSATPTSAPADHRFARTVGAVAPVSSRTVGAAPSAPARRVTRQFVRHYLEMVVAMFVGMVVLGLGVEWIVTATGAGGVEDAIEGPVTSAILMCGYMVAGMAAWMAHRKHTVRQNVEMNLAMVSPMAVLVPLEMAGVVDGHGLMVWLHVLMLGSMWLYMLWRPMTDCH